MPGFIHPLQSVNPASVACEVVPITINTAEFANNCRAHRLLYSLCITIHCICAICIEIRFPINCFPVQRIFRDKDELPITSNLTETIENALEKSEFLIVICSPHTKESIWVRREDFDFFSLSPKESREGLALPVELDGIRDIVHAVFLAAVVFDPLSADLTLQVLQKIDICALISILFDIVGKVFRLFVT